MATGVPIAVTSIIFPPDDGTFQNGTVKIGTDTFFIENVDQINNTFVGMGAGKNFAEGATGNANTFVGALCGYGSTGCDGFANTCVGAITGRNITSGSGNTFVGSSTGYNTTAGSLNIFIGSGAGTSNTEGNRNVFVGNGAGFLADTSENTYIGNRAGIYQTGDKNVFIGSEAGAGIAQNVGNGASNVCCGWKSGAVLTTGTGNVFVGESASDTHESGNYNVSIGFLSSVADGCENSMALGNEASVNANNIVQIGNNAITEVIFGDGTTTVLRAASVTPLSDVNVKENIVENIKGLDFISKLRPVSYNYKNDYKKTIRSGFIAQEVESAVNECEFTGFGGVIRPSEAAKHYSLNYSEIIPSLVKAIQELQEEVRKLRRLDI
jgi:hypothetical protein